jgi:hypothetical protein
MTDKTYELEADVRTKLVGEMISAAADSGPQTRAIMTLVQWHEEGAQGEEPDLSGLVTWKVECAIASDLAHIYREKLPEGVYGSQYDRQFVKLKEKNARRAAARRAAKRSTLGTLLNLA